MSQPCEASSNGLYMHVRISVNDPLPSVFIYYSVTGHLVKSFIINLSHVGYGKEHMMVMRKKREQEGA